MTPQEKANQLYGVFEVILHTHFGYGIAKDTAVRKCACAAVDLIMRENEDNDVDQTAKYDVKYSYTINEFYEIVKEEINKL